MIAPELETASPQMPVRRIAVASPDPNDPAFLAGPARFSGVVRIAGPEGDCTGSLLVGDGRHILTAAHCFNDASDREVLNPNPASFTVFFGLADGSFLPIGVEQVFVHPNWRAKDAAGNNENDNDLAIIKLASDAPDFAERYDIYRQPNEVGQVFTRVGYGAPGTGNGGSLEGPPVKRFGQNVYDALGDVFALPPEGDVTITPGLQLAYDFDNGLPQNDAFGRQYGIPQLGVDREINSLGGDSGGPAFINGQVAGVASYSFSPATPGVDINNAATDGSFGEYSADTRISAYANYIDATLAQSRIGNDVINGTSRNDVLYGNQGNDTLIGSTGNDTPNGGRGNDLLSGDAGDDLVGGQRGNDAANGGEGNDTVNGGKDNDLVNGGPGNDVLSGDLGDDVLTGGAGLDRFDVRPNDGIDTIVDFTDGQDLIGLKEGLSFASLTIQAVGNDTQIVAPGLIVVLQGVAPGAIDPGDFVLV